MCIVAHKWHYRCHLPVLDDLSSDLRYLLLEGVYCNCTDSVLFCYLSNCLLGNCKY